MAASALALALTDPKKLSAPLDAGMGDNGSPFRPPPALQNMEDGGATRHDVKQVTFETEKWW